MLFRYSLPALLWALVLLVLTLFPGKYIPPVSFWDFIGVDKLVHTGMFLIFTFLLLAAFLKQYTSKTLRSYANYAAVGIGVVYGALLEIMQKYLLMDRYFDVYDLLANAVGCVLGIFIFKFVRSKLKPKLC